jgi:hypothetical protein
MRLPRLRLRTLMIAVAVVALIMGIMTMRRRSERFRQWAAIHAPNEARFRRLRRVALLLRKSLLVPDFGEGAGCSGDSGNGSDILGSLCYSSHCEGGVLAQFSTCGVGNMAFSE